MPTEDRPINRCFLAFPYSREFGNVIEAVSKGVKEAGFEIVSADEHSIEPATSIREAIIGELARADCIVADLTDRNPNVYFELGLAQAMGKGLLLIAHKRSIDNTPFDMREYRLLAYDDGEKSLIDLSRKISLSLLEYRQSPQRSPVSKGLMQYSRPFFADWEQLPRSEVENLCRELLTQMGFRRLEWGKITPEIDLVAELPRKDPDGFEYKEIWLISMGLHAPIEMFLDMAAHEPDYLLNRVLHYTENHEKFLDRGAETPITFLVILFRGYGETGK